MRNYINLTLMAAAVLVATSGLPAQAADLTGTWEGTLACKGSDSDGVKIKNKFEEVTLEISQSGDDLNVSVTGFGTFSMDGVTYGDEAKPEKKGLVAMANCGNNGAVFNAGTDDFVLAVCRTLSADRATSPCSL